MEGLLIFETLLCVSVRLGLLYSENASLMEPTDSTLLCGNTSFDGALGFIPLMFTYNGSGQARVLLSNFLRIWK